MMERASTYQAVQAVAPGCGSPFAILGEARYG
jgi:hypothetical protein